MAHIDVAIIGGGPAGLAAAGTLARQLHTAVVFDTGSYRNSTSTHLHTVPGFDHKDPKEFRQLARDQITRNYSTIHFANVGVSTIKKKGDSSFEIEDESAKRWEVKKVILAIGSTDLMPELQGYDALWTKKIFHCLFCLGYEDRGAESSGVLAVQAMAMMPVLAVHMADNAAQLSHEVTIFTDGSDDVASQVRGIAAKSPFKIEPREISRLVDKDGGIDVEFKDGGSHHVTFLVHSPLTTPQGPFVKQLGLELSATGDIKAEAPAYQTSSRGVFAAGDCISPFKVVPHAIASGNFAAVAAATQLQAEKYGHVSMV